MALQKLKLLQAWIFSSAAEFFPLNWREVLPRVGNTAFSHHNSPMIPHPSSPLVPPHIKTFPFSVTLVYPILFILSAFPFLSALFPLFPFPFPAHFPPINALPAQPSVLSSFFPLIVPPFCPTNVTLAFGHLLPLIPLLSSHSPHSCPLIVSPVILFQGLFIASSPK